MPSNQGQIVTDEDVAIRASSDYWLLCPRDQTLAGGADGAISPGDPWSLTSATVDFLAAGVSPGQMALLAKPVSSFKPPGDSLVVASVMPGSVTLRRKGQPIGVGRPPGTASGLNTVEFSVATLGPQIALASYDLDRRYGINDLIAGRRTCDLYDPREVREAIVLIVLIKQYLDMSRGTRDQPDMFATKAAAFKGELDDLLARAVVHWKPSVNSSQERSAMTKFNTRIVR